MSQTNSNQSGGCEDPECGCTDPVFTQPMEALWFLAGRMNYAGVSEGVAKAYARDIEAILERSKTMVGAEVCTHEGLSYGQLREDLPDGTLLYTAPPQANVIRQDIMTRLLSLDEDCEALSEERQISLRLQLLDDLRNELLADEAAVNGEYPETQEICS